MLSFVVSANAYGSTVDAIPSVRVLGRNAPLSSLLFQFIYRCVRFSIESVLEKPAFAAAVPVFYRFVWLHRGFQNRSYTSRAGFVYSGFTDLFSS